MIESSLPKGRYLVHRRILSLALSGLVVSQDQIAATLASLLGENYLRDVPKAGQPIADLQRSK